MDLVCAFHAFLGKSVPMELSRKLKKVREGGRDLVDIAHDLETFAT